MPPTPESPDWLPWAAAAACAAFLAAVASAVARWRHGLPPIPRRPHEPVPWEGGDVLMVIGGLLVAAAFVGLVAGAAPAAGPAAGEPPLDQRIAANMLVTVVAALLAILWLVLRGASAADLGFVTGRGREDLALAAWALALVVAPLLALHAAVQSFVPYEHDLIDFLADHRDPWSLALVVAAAVVAAPLVEELFFRRILQGWLEKLLPRHDGWLAIVAAAAAFAAAHRGQGLAFIPLLPFGIVLGVIARRTGSIVPCILLHALFNAIGVVLLLAAPAPVTPPAN